MFEYSDGNVTLWHQRILFTQQQQFIFHTNKINILIWTLYSTIHFLFLLGLMHSPKDIPVNAFRLLQNLAKCQQSIPVADFYLTLDNLSQTPCIPVYQNSIDWHLKSVPVCLKFMPSLQFVKHDTMQA